MNWWIRALVDSMQFDGEDDGGGGGEGGEDAAAEEAPAAPPSMFKPSAPAGPPAVEEEPEVEEEEEPEVEDPEVPDAATAALQRRDAELVQQKRMVQQQAQSLQPLARAQQLIKQGKHGEAIKLLGIDQRELLADEYGEDMLPEKRKPDPEKMIGDLQGKHQTHAQQIQELNEKLAYSELGRDIRDVMDESEGLELMQLMAGKGRGIFYRGMVDRALEYQNKEGVWPDFKDLLADEEAAYEKRWTKDAAELLKIDKIRKALGVEFVSGGKKSKVPAKAAKPKSPTQQRIDEDPEPASLLSSDLEGTPPPLSKPPGKLTREQGKARMVEILAEARRKKEAEGT